MINLLKSLKFINEKHKKQLIFVLFLMIFTGFLESFAIALFLPFIAILSSNEILFQDNILNKFYLFFEFSKPNDFIIYLSALLLFVFGLKNILFSFQTYVQSLVLIKIQSDIEHRLMNNYLAQDYLFFAHKNSAELAQNIRGVSGMVGLVYTPAMNAASEFVIFTSVVIMLMLFQPILVIILALFSTTLMYLVYRYTKNRIGKYGEDATKNLVELNKWMYQAFGGIKELKILSKEDFFLNQSIKYSRATGWFGMKASMISTLTRPFIETIWFYIMIFMVLMALMFGAEGSKILPVIALIAAAAMRIMPGLNKILNASISIRQATYHIDTIWHGLNFLKPGITHVDSYKNTTPIKNILFSNIHFSYPANNKAILQHINFSIQKGQSTAFVGPSGAGKTTVVDLLLGLLEPQSGCIFVDNIPLSDYNMTAWRHNFGYVPQSIYLSDDTIKNNIAFGELSTEINLSRLETVIKQAQLSNLILQLPDGIDTLVGDRGARLSGGQRQRIGIARALYRDPPILVLDEATSALDNETEREITTAIRDLSGSKTIILIAHRLTTVAHCDQVVFLVDGTVHACGSYETLMRENEEFRRFAMASTFDIVDNASTDV